MLCSHKYYDFLFLLWHNYSIVATRTGNTVMFCHEGGMEVGDVDAKAEKVEVDIDSSLTEEQARAIVSKVPQGSQQ